MDILQPFLINLHLKQKEAMGSGLSEIVDLEKSSSTQSLERKMQELTGLSDPRKQVIKSQPLDDGNHRIK